ncbi:MAG: NAD(P)/FAD-dependent oxidoreductase [Burkholderiaceae bacterium]
MRDTAVVVVGAGIVGTAIASRLLLGGHRVTLIDMRPPGEYCSWGNAGILSPGSCVPFGLPGTLRKVPGWLLDPLGPLSIRPSYLPRLLPWLARFVAASRIDHVNRIADGLRALLLNTFDDWLPLARWAGAEQLIRRTGYLVVYETESGWRDSSLSWRLRRERGVVCQELDRAQIGDLEPEIAARFARGMFLPDHGFVANPGELTRSLARQFCSEGGVLVRDRVLQILREGARATGVATQNGAIEADAVVVAAGVHSAEISRTLGDPVPLESQRGYHVEFRGRQSLLRHPVMSGEGTFFATPMDTGLRIAGAVEFAGLRAEPNYRRAAALAVLARRMIPAITEAEASNWMGHRPCTPDTLPVIGRASRVSNVFYAFGHGHLGLGMGSATARLIGELVDGLSTSLDIAPYEARRFRGQPAAGNASACL